MTNIVINGKFYFKFNILLLLVYLTHITKLSIIELTIGK